MKPTRGLPGSEAPELKDQILCPRSFRHYHQILKEVLTRKKVCLQRKPCKWKEHHSLVVIQLGGPAIIVVTILGEAVWGGQTGNKGTKGHRVIVTTTDTMTDTMTDRKGSNQGILGVSTLEFINTYDPSKASLTSQHLAKAGMIRPSRKGRMRWKEPVSGLREGQAQGRCDGKLQKHGNAEEPSVPDGVKEQWGLRRPIEAPGSDSNCVQKNEKVTKSSRFWFNYTLPSLESTDHPPQRTHANPPGL